MAKVADTIMGGGFGTLDKNVNRRYFSGDLSPVTKKRMLFRPAELKNLPLYSSMSEASDAWNLLDSATKALWGTAGSYCGLSAYNAFIQDKILRLMSGLPGNATPNNLHQGLVGQIVIPQGAGHFLFRMIGNSAFAPSANIALNYYSDLSEEVGGGGYVKARFKYIYNPGGGDVEEITEISLNLSQVWTTIGSAIAAYSAQTGHWELEIEGNNVYGEFYFDNFYVQDANGIFSKDPYCKDVSRFFLPIIKPLTIDFQSVYPEV